MSDLSQPLAQDALTAAPRRAPAFWVAFAALFVVGFGNSMLLAVLPPIARQIAMPDTLVGAVFAVSAVLWVFSSPYWGRLSDRVGRKPVMTAGMWAYAASMGAFSLVTAGGLAGAYSALAAFAGMTLARAIFGGVGSATSPAAQAYVADVTPSTRRMQELAALTSAFALGSAVGPAACAWLAAQLGLLSPLIATTGLAVLMALAMHRLLPNRPPSEARSAGGRSWRLALDGRVRDYLLYATGVSLVTGVLVQTFAFYTLDRLGAEGAEGARLAAAGFSAHALALLLTQLFLLPRLRLRPRGLMVLGALVCAGGVLVQVAAGDVVWLVGSQLLQGLGFGMVRPGFTSGASLAVSPQEQGAVAGLVVAANGAGFVISPLAGNGLYEVAGMTAPLWLSATLLTALALFAWRASSLSGPRASPGPG